MENQIQKSESISKLVAAVVKVMRAVKSIEKGMTVGSGNNQYKGVADKDVKAIIGKEMEDAGLCIIPIDVESKTKVSTWEEATTYNSKQEMKRKQSVFTEVKTRYLLMHESGEYTEIAGYGHGVDSQDKSAGKATTYALKNTLLYTFLVPTGDIDDTDKTHSSQYETPPRQNNARNNGKPTAAKAPDVELATADQKQLLIKTLNNQYITEEEKSKMLVSINTITKERAETAIAKLQKTIHDRQTAAAAELQPEEVGNKAPLLKH